MGLEVSEGTVTAVLVTPGDAVAEGDTVAEVETEKAIAEIAAPRSGVIVSIEIEVGDTIPVGANLMRIGDSVDDSAAADSTAGPVTAGSSDVSSTGPVTEETRVVELETAGVASGSQGSDGSETSNGSGRRRA